MLFVVCCMACHAFTPRAKGHPSIRHPSLVRRHHSSADRTPAPGCNATRHDELLWGMARFFGEEMVDADAHRFYYVCHPPSGAREHVHFPMRDLAAAWDGAKALEFVAGGGVGTDADLARVQQRLTAAVRRTLSVYCADFTPLDDLGTGTHLSEEILLEPPNIGHSALLLLGLCHALRLSLLEHGLILEQRVAGLVHGILSMQNECGAYRIDFGKQNILRGIEFFPGEAMLALLTVHELSTPATTYDGSPLLEDSTRRAILPAMERAFAFYSNYYRIQDVDTNFGIWQVLAFSKYYDALSNSDDDDHTRKKEEVKKYILDMCQDICQSPSWKHQLARGRSFYANLDTVEIACGLEAVAEGLRLAREHEDHAVLAQLFQRQVIEAACFLKWAQEQVPEGAVGRGGLGYGGTYVSEQRLDVTGHALSALVKLRNQSVLLP